MKSPRGFSFAGYHAGIKAARKDVALVWSHVPCAAAGCMTINKCRAPAVEDAAARLPSEGISAIVLNSGNANALTGDDGVRHVQEIHERFAAVLGVSSKAVLSASTGVIGVPLPVKKVLAAAEPLAAARSGQIEAAAEAILTTDTRVKLAHRMVDIGGQEVCVAVVGKGSGMVAPSLATVLAVVLTDAAIEATLLQEVLRNAVDASFHHLVIDGEMSTNDTVFALANGLAGHAPLQRDTDDCRLFQKAVTDVCLDLARSVAEDGEGATKVLEVSVQGATSAAVASDLAKSVVGSTLVKAAVFGADPNWGRILAAMGGRAGAQGYPLEAKRVRVTLQGVPVFEQGTPTAADLQALRAKMRAPLVKVEVDLGLGDQSATALGCDLSYDYVKINADYMALTSASPDGVVSRDDRLTKYTPSFKRSLLVEALSYISRFTNKRAVVKYGGATMVKDSLRASLAGDINLLRSAGLLPIVVHGGVADIATMVESLGVSRGAAGRGVRVTSAEDVKVVEMVLSGKINSEIVSLLNQERAHAVGLSGKDAGLLRCRKGSQRDADGGIVGEITHVNHDLIEVLVTKQYVPVISPIGLGEDGGGYHLDADATAAEVAVAMQAAKLLYVTDEPGLVEAGELVSEIGAHALRERLRSGRVQPSMVGVFESCLRAIDGGVESVHVIDGRTPHSLIAELFTDRGVGTLILRD